MLDDLIVLDLTDITGQFAGRVLRDLGMRVIKVEPPGGDATRSTGPFKGGVPGAESSLRFAFLNGGKESITLDIASTEGRELLLELCEHADVFLESFPPGHLGSLGLGYEELSERNSDLVVASITGFGQYGPHSGFLAPDIVGVAMGGLMYISGDPSLPPVKPPETQAFYYGSMWAVYGVLLALFARENTGEGRHVDCSIQESIATQEHTIREAAFDGQAIVRNGSQHKSVAPANIFACRDGYVFLFVLGARHWETFLDLWADHPPEFDAPELAAPQRRRALASALNPLVEDFTRRYRTSELTALLQERGIPCLPVNSPREFLDEEQTRQRELLGHASSEGLGDYCAIRFPAVLDGERPAVSSGPPRCGEHNSLVFGDWARTHSRRVGATLGTARDLMSTGFLTGIRVVSLSTGIAGPSAGRLLASYGAEVFKVESRAGGVDVFRTYGNDPDASPRFVEVNLNTRSVTLNLKKPRGVTLLKELVAHCDVVIDNFRPGVLSRLGLSPEDLQAVNADIIVVRMPGLGSSGPHAHYGTWGPTLAAYSGLTHLWNHAGQERPVGSQGVYPDYLTGVMVPIIVVGALIARRRIGKGAVVDVAQVDLAAYMIGTTLLDVLVNGREPEPVGNESPNTAPHNCYPCAGEDRWCVIAVQSDEQWRALCTVVGRPELMDDVRFSQASERWRNRSDLDALLSEWTRKHAAEDVMQRLQAAGVPAGVVQSGSDLCSDVHLAARGFIETVQHPVLGAIPVAGLPLQFSEGGHEELVSPPPLGADNAYVITELLGYEPAELERWESEHVVY